MAEDYKAPGGGIPQELDEAERRRIEKYSKLEQNKTKRTLILGSVTALLILLFAGGVVGGAVYLSGYETPVTRTQESFSPLPEGKEQILEAFILPIPGSEEIGSVEVKENTDVSISGDFTVESGRDYLKNDIGFILSSVEDSIGDGIESRSCSFGDDFTAILPDFSFSAAQLKDAVCEDDFGSDLRRITLVFEGATLEKAKAEPSLSVFGLTQAENYMNAYAQSLSDMFTVSSAEVNCDSLEIRAEIDRLTGVLNRIELVKGYKISARTQFTGDYSAIGSERFTFSVCAKESYSFLHAGVDIHKDVLFVEKGDSDEIIRSVTTDEDHDKIIVSWSSDKPEILSVDEKGYFKAHESSREAVTVTAKYEYNGQVYTDSCTVYVREPVSGVRVSEEKLTMTPGEKLTVSASVSPKKATFTDLSWYSEDESIAAVDENTGEITALTAGEVKVYCVTFDGGFRDSCTVTVAEKEG